MWLCRQNDGIKNKRQKIGLKFTQIVIYGLIYLENLTQVLGIQLLNSLLIPRLCSGNPIVVIKS